MVTQIQLDEWNAFMCDEERFAHEQCLEELELELLNDPDNHMLKEEADRIRKMLGIKPKQPHPIEEPEQVLARIFGISKQELERQIQQNMVDPWVGGDHE